MGRWSVMALALLSLLAGVPAWAVAQDAETGDRAPNADDRAPNADADRAPDADGREPNADSDSRAPSAAAEPATGKVAVVVAGDPDEALRATATAIDDALAADGLQRPTDPGLRAALRGQPNSEEDGLERVRRERRGLGFGDDDRPILARLGTMAGADAVVVVSRQDGAMRAEVFDVHAERFYRDRLDAEPIDAVVAFTARAARAAHRRAQRDAEASVATEPEAETEAEEPTHTTVPSPEETANAAASEGDDEAEEDDDPSPVREWFRKNWAFILAGALLVGVVTGFVIRSRRDDPGLDAVILFRPGE
ncbi:MAG: hypothetical protein JJ863_23005 [Deltaproteobacteria bacterium]|nr:hypothetical protein [Deltaproteobacteria bacterium]